MPLFNTGNFLTTSFASINRGIAWVTSLLDWNSRKQITVNGAKKTADAVWGTNADQVIETFATYTDQSDADTSWVSADTTMQRANPTTDVLDWNTKRDNTANEIYYDLGSTISDTAWVLRFKIRFDQISRATSSPTTGYFGISDNTSSSVTTQDFIGVGILQYTSGDNIYLLDADGAVIPTTTSPIPQVFVIDTDYYCEIKRLSATKAIAIFYRDSQYTEVINSVSATIPSTITNLRYFKVANPVDVSNANELNGTIDDIEFYDGVTTVENIPSQQTADALFGDSHNQVIEDFTTYASQGDADADWVPVETKFLVNITNDELDWNAVRDGTNDSIAYDLGASVVSDSNWVLRFKARVDGITGGGTGYGKGIAIGLSSANQTSSDSNSQDSMSFTIETQDTDTNLFKLGAGDGAGMLSQNVETGSISDAVFQNTWYIELIRDGSQLRGNVYRNSDFSNLYESLTLNTTGTISGLRYLVARNRNGTASAQSGGNNGAIDDIEFFNNITEVNPSTITDYVLPIKIQGDADLKRKTTENLEELFASDGWVDNDSSKVGVNTTNQRLEFIGTLVNGDNNTSVFDLGAGNVSDSKFTCDIDLEFTTLTASANNIFWIGFSDSDQTAGENTGQDFLGFRIVYTSGTKKFGTIDSDGASPDVLADNQQTMADITTGRKYYLRLQRLSTTKYQLLIFADKARTIQLDKIDGTCASTTDSLRYIKVMPYESVTEAGEISGFIDKIRFWNGITNPVAQETATTTQNLDSSTGWTTSASGVFNVDTGNGEIDFLMASETNTATDAIVYDLENVLGVGGRADSEKWCLRISQINFSQFDQYCRGLIGLSDSNETAHGGTSQDFIGLGWVDDHLTASTDIYFDVATSDGTAPNAPSTNKIGSADIVISTDYYMEVSRISEIQFRVRLWRNGFDEVLVTERFGTCTNSTQNLRYIKIMEDGIGVPTGNKCAGTIQKIEFWNGISSPNASGRKIVFTNDDITDTAIQYSSKTLSYDPINGDYYGEVRIPTLTTGTDFNLYMYHNYSPSANPNYVPEVISSSVGSLRFIRNEKTFSTTSENAGINGLFVKPDGTKFYTIAESGGAEINEYDMSTAFDPTTASFNQVKNINAQGANPKGIFFKPDGTKMFITVFNNSDIDEYTLSTAWDISTASYDSNVSIGYNTAGLTMSADGTKALVSDNSGNIQLWSGTAWDISTFTATTSVEDVPELTGIVVVGQSYNSDGSKMYLTNYSNADILEYNLPTAYDIRGRTLVSITRPTTSETNLQGIHVVNSDKTVFIAGATSVEVDSFDITPIREESVYDEDYKGVWHLDGNSIDSTGYGNNGTNTSVDWTEQNNDVGLLANGTTTGIDVGSDSSLANIFSGGGHISAIINPKSDGEGNNGMILHKRTSDGWQFLVTGESGGFVKIQFLRGFSTTDGFWTTTNLVIPLNEVSFVDVFYNEDSVNNDPIIKVNGITQAITEGATPAGTASSETSETLHIADSSGSTNSFDGFISNVKLSDKIRPSSQAIATYNAEKSGSDIITTASSVSQ